MDRARLLLGHNQEFGEGRDSGVSQFLGCGIEGGVLASHVASRMKFTYPSFHHSGAAF